MADLAYFNKTMPKQTNLISQQHPCCCDMLDLFSIYVRKQSHSLLKCFLSCPYALFSSQVHCSNYCDFCVFVFFFKLPSQYLTFGRPAIYISRRCIFEETAAKDFSHVFGHRAAEFCTLQVRVHKNMFFFSNFNKI